MIPVKEIVHTDVSLDSIFKYVIKATHLCPIEKDLDEGRYEVYGDFIYDRQEGKYLYQDETFSTFSNKLQALRENKPKSEQGEAARDFDIVMLCMDLLKIAPKTIQL